MSSTKTSDYPTEKELTLRELQEARVREAGYYMDVVQKLKTHINVLEGSHRDLREILQDIEVDLDPVRGMLTVYPPDHVILGEPEWRSMCPIKHGWTRQEPIPLSEQVDETLERMRG